MKYILQSQLLNYSRLPLYPMHMPGHKRRTPPAPGLPFQWDVTELRDTDDLHEPSGILKEAMERCARVFGAEQSFFLVNGSSGGLLAAVRTLAPAGSYIIIGRNCHKSLYHAIELGGLKSRYIYPPVLPDWGVYGSVRPEDVEEALNRCPEAKCVVITSPSYEGVVSDIESIARCCHEQGAKLLVDEAHGAHLGFSPYFPQSALRLGADIVVQSAHKTLPSLTQTAFLHVGRGSGVDIDNLRRQLAIFQTSSPSYPLMASLDGCTGIIREDGDRLFRLWEENLRAFDEKIRGLKKLRLLCRGGVGMENVFAYDPGKLCISTAHSDVRGTELARELYELGFETEMACGDICLGMTALGEAGEGIAAFGDALLRLDERLNYNSRKPALSLPRAGRQELSIADAVLQKSCPVPMESAMGRVSAEYLMAYPPGVPLIVPGERVEEEFLRSVKELSASGTDILHSNCKIPHSMLVLA